MDSHRVDDMPDDANDRSLPGGMALRLARLLNLVLAGVLTGNEVGTKAVVHPALDTLPRGARYEAERAVVGRYGRVMPVLMPLTILSAVPLLVAIRDRRSPAFRATLTGVVAYGAMVAVTVGGELPINRRILDPAAPAAPDDFEERRRRWDRNHTARVACDLIGFACFCVGALAGSEGAA